MKGKQITAGLLMVAALMAAPVASAHTLWVNVSDYMPTVTEEGTAKTRLYVGWGHHFPVDGLTKATDFEKLSLITPQGAVKNISLETEGISSSQVHFDTPGTYLISLVRKPATNTTYMKEGKMVKVKETKVGKSDVIASVRSQQFAKSLIRIGEKSGEVSRVLGHKLELIPLVDPYELKNNVGARLPVKVLFDGKPVVFAHVTGMYEGYSNDDESSTMALTDKEGVAQLRIDHWGVWVVKTRVERPATGDLAKDVDTEKYYASLTFLVP